MSYREPEPGETRESGTVHYPNADGITMTLTYSCKRCAREMGLRWWWSPFPSECAGCGVPLS